MHQQHYNMSMGGFLPPTFEPYPPPPPLQSIPGPLPPPPLLIRIPPNVTRPSIVGDSSQHPPPPLIPINLPNNQAVIQNQVYNQSLNSVNPAFMHGISSIHQEPTLQYIHQNPDRLFQLNCVVDQVPKLVLTPVSFDIKSISELLFNKNMQTEECNSKSGFAGSMNTITPHYRMNVNSSANNEHVFESNVSPYEHSVNSSRNYINSSRSNIDLSGNNINSPESTVCTPQTDTSTSSNVDTPESSPESQKNHIINHKYHNITKSIAEFVAKIYGINSRLVGYKVMKEDIASEEKNTDLKLILQNNEGKITTVEMGWKISGDDDDDNIYNREKETNFLESVTPDNECKDLSPPPPKKGRAQYQKKATKPKKKKEKKDWNVSTTKKFNNTFNYDTTPISSIRRSERIWQNTCHRLQNLWYNEQNVGQGIMSFNMGNNENETPSVKDRKDDLKNTEQVLKREPNETKCLQSDILSCNTVIHDPEDNKYCNNFILQGELPDSPAMPTNDADEKNKQPYQTMSPDSTQNQSKHLPIPVLKLRIPICDSYLKDLKGKNSEQLRKSVTFQMNKKQNLKVNE